MPWVMVLIIATKSVILVLGGIVTYFGYKAYRRTGSKPIGFLSAGFGIITLGGIVSGIVDQILGVDFEVGVLIYTAITALGLGIITYSMFRQGEPRKIRYVIDES